MSNHYNLPKIQHYVPKFLLRNFVTNEGEQIYVFDKQREKVFLTNVKNVASEQGFYDFQLDDSILTLEPSLSDIETRASEVIGKILLEESLKNISEEEQLLLSSFIAIQMNRVKQTRQRLIDANSILEQRFKEWGVDPKDVVNYESLDEEGSKQIAIDLVRNHHEFVPYIYDKWWLLFKTSKVRPFFISDNPVVMQNTIDYGPQGNLGLAVRGIEVYFPLSKTIILALYCRSHEAFIRDRIEKMPTGKKGEKGFDHRNQTKSSYKASLRLWDAITTKRAVMTTDMNMTNFNSLQVAFSTRFVFSYSSDFSLIYRMLRDHPNMKSGPTIIST